MDLHMRQVAAYGGDGLLTCVAVYDGTCYVGAKEGSGGLYSVSDSGFVAVSLPLGSASYGDVEALTSFDAHLFAFGWLYEGADRDGQPRTWVIWRYDGSDWVQLVTGTVVERDENTHWARPAQTPDGTALAVGLFGPSPGGGLITGQQLWAGLLEAEGLVSTTDYPQRGLRGAARIGDDLLRVTGETGAWSLPGVGSSVYVPTASADTGDIWPHQQFLTRWLGRVWATTARGGWQQLVSTRGRDRREGPAWDVADLGAYRVLCAFRNRLVLFGRRYGDDWQGGVGTEGTEMSPVYGVWDPPFFRLNTLMDWHVVSAEPDEDKLWLVGARSTTSNPRDASEQALLVAGGMVALHALTVEWGDGLGGHLPTVESLAVQWGREYPTEVTVTSLELQWGDGNGNNQPTLQSIGLQWGNGQAAYQPTVDRLEAQWGKGGDQRPTLQSVAVQWGDGLGNNQPTLQSIGVQWRVPAVGLKRPTVQAVTLEHGDGSGDHTPTLQSIGVQWGDGGGANQPTLQSVAAHWSIGYTDAHPTLQSVTAQWADHDPWPPRSGAKVSLLKIEWNNDGDPTADGDDILWLTHTADEDVVGVRVVTSADLPDGRDLQCLIRTDDSAAVDAWHTYQRFESNRTVVVEEPGTDLRIGVAKAPTIADDTDVFVQLQYAD